MTDTNTPSEPEPAAPAAAETPPAAAPAPAEPPPAKGGSGCGAITLILLVLLGGAAGAWFFWLPHHPLPALSTLKLPFLPRATPAPGTSSAAGAPAAPSVVTVQPAPPSMAASSAPPSSAPSSQVANSSGAPAAPVQEEAASLVTDAQHAGLSHGEVSALAVENGKLGAATPEQANALAMAMARNEAATLARNAAVREREVENALGSWNGGADAIATVRRARANLTAAIAAVNQAPDGVSAIEAARRAVAAYPAFAGAYVAATRDYLPAKRAQFWAVAGQCRSLYNEVYAYAANAKAGGVFATEGRRQAFQEMQDNVTRAQGDIGELNQLAYDERYDADPGRLAANLNHALGIRAALYNLDAVSGDLYEANK